MKNKYYLLLILILGSKSVFSTIGLQVFSTGYYYPVDIKNCGDDRLFIVEQDGHIQICDTGGVKNAQPFLDISNRVKFVGSNDERGLLGLAFPPDFLTSGYFYVNYVALSGGRTRISRFHVDPSTPDSADPNSEEILLSIYQPYSNHKGGHLAFGPDGYLYIGMGDGGLANDPGDRAQNPDSLLGKMLRIAVDTSVATYTIPSDNPFANGAQGAPEVWQLGVRNPWRWSFDKLTGDLWIGDVGQNLIEEIDFLPVGSPGGLNFGWRCYEAGAYFDTSSHNCPIYSETQAPVASYNHNPYCSVTGGYRCRGAKYQELYGKYFFVDFCVADMRYLEANVGGGFSQTNLGVLNGTASISGFGEDKNGELYCAGLYSNTIYRFYSTDCSPVSTINAGVDSIDGCGSGSVSLFVPYGNGNTFQWTFGGNPISTDSVITATQAGMYYVTTINQACSSTDSINVLFTNLNVTVNGLDTIYCIYDPVVGLTPNYIGGAFSGPGTNGNIATFDPALAGIGMHNFMYTYTTATGCIFTYSQPVRVDACSNVPENIWTNTITIYPNPSQGDVRLNIFSQVERKFTLDIMDVTGRLLYQEKFALSSGQNEIPIHSLFSKGVYLVKFSDEHSSSSRKLIIQ